MTTPKHRHINPRTQLAEDQPIETNADDQPIIDMPIREPMNFSKAVSGIDYDRRSTVHRIADQLTAEMRYSNDPRLPLAYKALIAAADAMYDATKTLRQLAALNDQKTD